VILDPGTTPDDDASADIAGEVPPVPSQAGHDPTNPATGSEADADLELLDSIEEELDEVERALARLDDDER
jgi:hypothetical protein